MASSKVVRTSPDLPRQSSACSLLTLISDLQQTETSKNSLGSVNMDDFMKSFFPPSETNPSLFGSDSGFNSVGGGGGGKVEEEEEVRKEIVAGGDQRRVVTEESGYKQMTLEDFLTKAGAVREEDVKGAASVVMGPVRFGVSSATATPRGCQFAVVPIQAPAVEGSSLMEFGNGTDRKGAGVGRGRGRGKRKSVPEPVDKATELKHRRMIKNRESAARSRERKQAYTVELECLVTQLEEENARLVREEAEQNKLRLKQLMENLVTVLETSKPPRKLRRVNSTEW